MLASYGGHWQEASKAKGRKLFKKYDSKESLTEEEGKAVVVPPSVCDLLLLMQKAQEKDHLCFTNHHL